MPPQDSEKKVAGDGYCPTPEQIEAECRRIQADWLERDFWRRAGYENGCPPPWAPPVGRVSNPHSTGERSESEKEA